MKIATFNINNVNKRLANLLDWLRKSRPDVPCLQEVKTTDSEFPAEPDQKGGLRCCMARTEIMEWRGHSRTWPRTGFDADGIAW
jgi:exonuclease III